MSELETKNSETEMTEQKQSQAESPPVFSEQIVTPGELLKKKREELGYSRERVAEALHMTPRYVKALETGEYCILPGKTFVKGYIKSYATLLKDDVDKVMASYQQYSEALEETQETKAKVMRARKSNDQNKRWLAVTAIIIVIVVAASWWYQ